MSICTLFFYFKQNIKNQLIKNKNLFISPASSLTFQKKTKKTFGYHYIKFNFVYRISRVINLSKQLYFENNS